MAVIDGKGSLHRLKLINVPLKKLRDKGTPLDNLSNFDTSKEEIVLLSSASALRDCNLMFITGSGLIKQVQSSEFETNQRTVVSTKLDESDRLIAMEVVREIGQNTVACWTENGYFLRFALDDVPLLKKNSKGVRAIKLKPGDLVAGGCIVKDDPVVELKGKTVHLHLLRIGLRGGTGTRQRT